VNAANAITLSRFPAPFIIAALLYLPFPGSRSLAFVLYLLTGLSDWLDGYIARRCEIVSNFGKFMDALGDKILTLGLFFSLLALRILPVGFLFPILLILCREFFVTGIRLVASSRGIVIPAERSGKIKTIVQMVSIGAFICSQAIFFDLTFLSVRLRAAAAFPMYAFGLLLFAIALVCTVESGIRYTIKYRRIFDGTGPLREEIIGREGASAGTGNGE
jgi:CDP-diacylglycerol--glycerol-3-phosphate 3-phosphatidyltransferase